MNAISAADAAVSATVDRSAGQWWHKPFQVFQTNLREIDAGLDVEATLDYIQGFGADTWLVNAGGILSFYPTELPFQTRNPHLAERSSGDLLGDVLEAAHRRGVRVLARMDFSKVAMPIAQQHPEWCFVGPDGSWQVYNGLVSMCPSAGYYQEKSFEILDEVMDRYDVDGFFFNMFGFNEVDYSGHYRGVSQNESGARAFAEYSGGLPLPTGPESEHYNIWRSWCAEVVSDLGARIRGHINRRRPRAALVLRQSADILFDEANNALGRELWHHQTSASVSALRSAHPGVAVMENCVSFIDMPYRMAGEQPEHFAQYLIQTISRGGNPSTYIMGVPGAIPYPSLELAQEVTRFHDRWSDVYEGLTPAATVGLVRPDPVRLTPSQHHRAVAEFRGLYAAMQERHTPFDVVPEESLATLSVQLGRFGALVLPDVGALDAQTCDALDSFVEAGGSLLLTGNSGFDDDGAAQLTSMPARRILRTMSDPDDLNSTYVAEPSALQEGRFGGRIVPVYGEHHEVEQNDGATSRLCLLPSAPYGPPEKAYGHRPSDTPGYLSSASGISVIPWTIGYAYHELGLTSIRDHFTDVLGELCGEPDRLVADLPEHVEITVQRNDGGTVVHLVNFSGRTRKSFMPPSTVRNGTLRLCGAGEQTAVHALVADRRCVTYPDGDDVVVALPDIERFEVVAITEGKEQQE